jgi:hypothetical protein
MASVPARASPDEARDCRGRLEASRPSAPPAGSPASSAPRPTSFPWLDRPCAILRCRRRRRLIGPDLLVYHLTMWIKEPGDDAFVSWHQDATYFGLDPADQHVTA